MRYRGRRGRAREASAQDAFERALCGEDSPGQFAMREADDRKTRQLCRQVQRALMLADVAVESVEAIGAGGGQLLVRVTLGPDESAIEALGRLHARTPMLRAMVARAICRKRVPGLSFVMVAGEGGQHEQR